MKRNFEYSCDTSNTVDIALRRSSFDKTLLVSIPPTTAPDDRSTLALNKRRRSASIVKGDLSQSLEDADNSLNVPVFSTRQILRHVRIQGPAVPLSAFANWQPPAAPAREAEAIAFLKRGFVAVKAEPNEHKFLHLDQFSVYRIKEGRAQLCTLDRVQNRDGYSELWFDGVLSLRGKQRFVKMVKFKTLAVDGYFDVNATNLRDKLCIQSALAERDNIWFQLGTPSVEYKRFYDPFVWIVHFTKYFIEYLDEQQPNAVTLNDFRRRFYDWICTRYRKSDVQPWLDDSKLQDFRTTVANNCGFLLKEAHALDESGSILQQPVWKEVNCEMLQRQGHNDWRENDEVMTTVTPFIHQCFRELYFRSKLDSPLKLNKRILAKMDRRKRSLGLTPNGDVDDCTWSPLEHLNVDFKNEQVQEGTVVCLRQDLASKWNSTAHYWYAYVQARRKDRIDLIWLYEPSDTTLGSASYPFKKEMFFSDNCNCGNEAYFIDQVVGIVTVDWFVSDPYIAKGLFVRQKFRTIQEDDTYDFVSLSDSDFHCKCQHRLPLYEECLTKYRIGDTVLAKFRQENIEDDILQPFQICGFYDLRKQVELRLLPRLEEGAHNNELLLSSEVLYKPPSHIVRRCHVRFFNPQDLENGRAPGCYGQGGEGDFWFIVGADGADFSFPPITVGPDPDLTIANPLRGMGIFCGGGNFDRGLEDGGTVKFQHAIDWDSNALHTYRANCLYPNATKFFLGSVDTYLDSVMASRQSNEIADLGEIDLIAAGSPCPGFSQLQKDKRSDQSLRNASMVASAVSFVDLYSPKYFLLENVMGLKGESEVFSQILSALVSLGYQVQQFNVAAWNHGSCQSRPRLFISASAPGLEPLPPPQHTHANPPWKIRKSNLGRSTNGLAFGESRDEYTPFPHISVEKAFKDLPFVGDGQVQLHPAVSDMRIPCGEGVRYLERIHMVPVRPRGMNLAATARYTNTLSGKPLEYYNSLNDQRRQIKSGVYKRISPSGLMPTVTTALRLGDLASGGAFHWNEHRPLTVAELKRSQGYRDEDVIIGSAAQQCKVIGNSVDRHAGFALGLSLRHSWITSNLAPSATHTAVTNISYSSTHSGALPSEIMKTNSSSLRQSDSYYTYNDLDRSVSSNSVPQLGLSPSPSNHAISTDITTPETIGVNLKPAYTESLHLDEDETQN